LSERASLRGDSRGVSEVLGAILVFGLVLTLIVLVQATAVPQANEETEFKHNEEVRGDMAAFADASARTAATGSPASVDVETGLQYPTRVVFLNPPAVAGALRTDQVGSGEVSVANVEATDSETADYVDGSLGTFDTVAVNYSVDYNEYSGAPDTVYEGGVLYNSYENGEVTVADEGPLVSGNRINLLLIDGQLSQSSTGTTSLAVDPLSAPARTVSVTNETGSNVTITVPTRLDASTLENDVLRDEMTDRGGNVVEVRNHASRTNAVDVELRQGVTYRLRMSKLGVGSGGDEPSAHYITPVDGDETSVPNNGLQTLRLQVRDEFNNPVTNATVNMTVENGNGKLHADGTTDTTLTDLEPDGNGIVEVTYDAPVSDTSPLSVDVRASLNVTPAPTGNFNADTRQNATFDLRIINGSKVNRTGPLINAPKGVVLTDSTFRDANCVPENGPVQSDEPDCEVEFVLKNNADEQREITKIRYTFFSSDTISRSGSVSSANMEIQDTGPTLFYAGNFQDVSIPIASGDDESVRVHLFNDNSQDEAQNIDEGDFLVIELVIDGVERKTFFFAPQLDPDEVTDT